MKAYITSIGERTTDACAAQLKRLGYDVVLIGGVERWDDKYRRFLGMADEDCLRVDADVILNGELTTEVLEKLSRLYGRSLMLQFSIFDFCSMNVRQGQPIFYRKAVLEKIRRNLSFMNHSRPEAWAWRLPEINPHTSMISDRIVGIHGFFQTQKEIDRAIEHRIARKQEDEIELDLINDLKKL
jgi:hypothetical protein